MALVLAAAAIVTAAIGTRAALLAGDAAGNWQKAAKQQIDTSSFTAVFEVTDYAAAAVAERAQRARAEKQALIAQAAASIDPALVTEGFARSVGVHSHDPAWAQMRSFGARGSVYDPRDPLRWLSLAEAKSKKKPDDLQRAGDHASRKAVRIELAAIVAALAFFLGVAAKTALRLRRSLLAAAVLVLAAAAAFEIALEATL